MKHHPNTFRFGESVNVHKLGDPNCKGCRWDTPQICPKCDEGILHIELSPKKIGPVFNYHCDLCAGKGKDWQNHVH